jgi:hypothetical protein
MGQGLHSQLHLGLRGGRSVVIAAAAPIKVDQRECLTAVCEALRASRWGRKEADLPERTPPPPPEADQTQIWRCPSCGIWLEPVDQPKTRCRSCDADCPVPDDLRQRVRAALLVSAEWRRNDALVARVLAYPGARRINLAIYGGACIVVLLIPVTVWTPGLSVFAVPSLVALLGVARAQVADRSAARYLAVHFAARSPQGADQPHACRNCGAPLTRAPVEGHLVVRCIYCEAGST